MKTLNFEQGTPEWHQWRKGKITGTTLKDIMGTPKKREDALYEIIAERLTVGVEDSENYENAMDRGLRLESDAVSAFELETGKSVEVIGGAEDDKDPMIANSPDGLIGETEAIEIKCLAAKNHVKMWLKNEVPDDYKWQVVQYFVVNEKLERLYFVGYHPDVTMHQLNIIIVTREKILDEIKKAVVGQKQFLLEVDNIIKKLIPEL